MLVYMIISILLGWGGFPVVFGDRMGWDDGRRVCVLD